MLRVKVFPAVDFLYAFLQTRNFLLVNDKPEILHYTGDKQKELQNLLKEDKPDLLIIHSKELGGAFPPGIFWVYHPVRTEKDLYKTRKLLTNSYRLCQHYYQRLGLQAEIVVAPKKEEPKQKDNKLIPGLGKIKLFWLKIKDVMLWE